MSTRKYQASSSQPVSGPDVGNLLKIHLIRKFQRLEGNVDCCASAYTRVCRQFECLWRDECLVMAMNEAQPQGSHE